jgi:hypothetical protein
MMIMNNIKLILIGCIILLSLIIYMKMNTGASIHYTPTPYPVNTQSPSVISTNTSTPTPTPTQVNDISLLSLGYIKLLPEESKTFQFTMTNKTLTLYLRTIFLNNIEKNINVDVTLYDSYGNIVNRGTSQSNYLYSFDPNVTIPGYVIKFEYINTLREPLYIWISESIYPTIK